MFQRVLAALLAALLAAPAASAADAQSVRTIDVVVSLTGPAAFVGMGVQRTLRLLEGSVNQDGGINGTPLHFAFEDDQSNPQTAIALANGLLARNAPLILGPSVAATCGAVMPLVKTSAVEYCFSPAMHPAPGSYSYSAGMSTFDILAVAMRYFHHLGKTRIALLTSTDASGLDAERAFDYAAALPDTRGVVRVANEHFNINDVSVAAQLARIKQANPDVLFAWTTGTAFSTVLRGANDSGLTIPIATSTGNMSYDQMLQLNQYATDRLYFVGFRYFDRDRIGRGPLRATIDRFYRAFAQAKVPVDVQPGLAWDVGLLVVAALRSLGPNATAAQIKASIDGERSFVGIDGLYDFPGVPQRGLNDLAAVMTRWDPAGKRWIVVSRPGGTPRPAGAQP